MDGVTGLSSGSASAYASLGAIVRFNRSGFIDARNGGSYSAARSISYVPGTSYRFRLVVNIPTHLYSIYVTPAGSAEISLGTNYAFRTEQATVSSLNSVATYREVGSHSVCNFAVSGTSALPDTAAPSIPVGLSAAATSAYQINLSWKASSDNTGVAGYRVYRNGNQIASTTSTSYSNVGLSPATAYTYTVAAFDAAGNVSALSSATSATTQTVLPAPVAGAPNILYTDLVAGPTSGGENGKGTYLSIFGKNFGFTGLGSSVKVYIGGVEVDNYRYLGPSLGRKDIQQITVQVGALGNASTGVALPIRVVVNGVGSNTNNTFMVQPGEILFVDNVSGNDSTALKNDISRPWRYVQTSSEGGALSKAGPGDVIVLRGKAVWTDVGLQSRWFRFLHATGSQPTGAAGTGYIAVMAYPGEAVRYVPPGGTRGGIHGVGEGYAQYADWIVISGLRIESAASSLSDGAPINLQANSDHWRVVNNDVGPWPASSSAGDKAGGIVGNGDNLAILGNRVHDIGGGTLNHGMYFDTGTTNLEIAYNEIANVSQGNLIQTFDNLGTGQLNNINIHHNLLHDGGRYGLNISTGTNSLNAWNNVIYNTVLAGVRFSVQTNASSSFAILYNTLYNNSTGSGGAPIVNDWNLYAGTALVANNIVVAGPDTGSSSYYSDSGNDSAIQIKRNLWYGLNRGGAPSQDSEPVGGLTDLLNPLFVNATSGNLKLLAGSPASGKAIVTNLPFAVVNDHDLMTRPQGGLVDVGAYEAVP